MRERVFEHGDAKDAFHQERAAREGGLERSPVEADKRSVAQRPTVPRSGQGFTEQGQRFAAHRPEALQVGRVG
jgi:hypothetical protein